MQKKKNGGGFSETVKTVVYAVLIALVVRTVAFEPFNIPSGSMIPTLLIGDYLFVSKYSYGYSKNSLPFSLPLFEGRIMASPPERGDVAVFKVIDGGEKKDYIKRVVGLPGDRIQVKDGVLHINGEPVERRQVEDFVERDLMGSKLLTAQYVEVLPGGRSHLIRESAGDRGMADNTREFLVPDGHYFMMGDNRDNSQDSRFETPVGFVPAENLVGRAEVIFFSTDGSAALWQIWKWPFAIRYGRMFNVIV